MGMPGGRHFGFARMQCFPGCAMSKKLCIILLVAMMSSIHGCYERRDIVSVDADALIRVTVYRPVRPHDIVIDDMVVPASVSDYFGPPDCKPTSGTYYFRLLKCKDGAAIPVEYSPSMVFEGDEEHTGVVDILNQKCCFRTQYCDPDVRICISEYK
jgi:hypothetical protein